ncbi:MAG: putative hydro-lyase [Yoonia sp.]
MNAISEVPMVAADDGQKRFRQTEVSAIRQAIRSGEFASHTSGLAGGNVQGNVVILPKDAASDFLRFCQNNRRPCPIIGLSEPGDPMLTALGVDIDIRTDLPRYHVWENGVVIDKPTDVSHLWRDDLVTFVIGCSFSFEQALVESGVHIRHIEQGCNVPMFKTNIQTTPAGPFSGPMVVSMRPMKATDAIKAIQITSRYPEVHGAPVHIGDPSLIGISDLGRPDYGDAVDVRAGDIPVFWACGVTPQAALLQAKPAFCITHAPGSMLITDLLNHQLASF